MSKTGNGEHFVPVDGPEIVVGIVAPVGANLASIVRTLVTEFKNANYTPHVIRVSALMHQLVQYRGLESKNGLSEFERIRSHMVAGTELRTSTERGDILALLSIGEIRRIRERVNVEKEVAEEKANKQPLERTVYILRSLKHPDEIATLKAAYGDGFFVVSAYSPREERVKYLSQTLANSENSSDVQKYRSNAEELICIDEKEESNSLGQNVSDAFPLGDVFIDSRGIQEITSSISRFIDYYFGFPYPSPTRDEFSMFIAKSTSLRSADMARQVGACISTDDGDIVAVGCNDVPKVGGGLYWIDDEFDKRDFRLGFDSISKYKNEILKEFISKLQESEWLSDDKKNESLDNLLNSILEGEDKAVFKDAKVMDIIEYGRSVHAEMAAITYSAKRGIFVKDCTLYSTTFPCHLCARHIVSSGIKRVVYVEPYPKSQAKNLYDDSIVVDPHVPVTDRVVFESFVGISPRMFSKIFEQKGKRKNKKTGQAIDWDRARSNPKIDRFVLTYLSAEEVLVGEELRSVMEKNGLESVKEV